MYFSRENFHFYTNFLLRAMWYYIHHGVFIILYFRPSACTSDSCMQYERIEEYIERSKAVYKCMNEKSLCELSIYIEEVWTFDVEWKNLQCAARFIFSPFTFSLISFCFRDTTLYNLNGRIKKKGMNEWIVKGI